MFSAGGSTSEPVPPAARNALAELLATADLARAQGLSDDLAAGPVRDIAVVHGPPGDLVAALMVGWAVLTGAAVLVEPDPARWPLALVWARPTIVAGDAHDLDLLSERLRRLERDPQRLRRRLGPLGRARAVVRVGVGESEGVRWLRSLGLPIVTLEP